MKNGDTRRGPLSFSVIAVSAIVASPPIPEPMMTPVRSRSASSSGIQPASRTAWVAAAMASRMKRSTLRWSLGAIQSSGLNVPSDPSPEGTSQAMLHGRWLASKLAIRPAPDCPATSRAQVSSTPQASGVTSPSPVITTRRIGPRSLPKNRPPVYRETRRTDKPQSPGDPARPCRPAAPVRPRGPRPDPATTPLAVRRLPVPRGAEGGTSATPRSRTPRPRDSTRPK